MNGTKKSTAGRKPKISPAEVRDIINRYLVAHGEETSVLTQHGIYEKLADFARRLNEKYSGVRGYHFYGDETKAYISALVADFSTEEKSHKIGCAYTPLDLAAINQLARRHRYDELLTVLRERENYMKELYDKVAQTAAKNDLISSQFTIKAEALQEQEATLSALEAEVDRLTAENKEKGREINSLQNEIRSLKRIIREKDDELADLSRKNNPHKLGINDNIQAQIRREADQLAREMPDQEESQRGKIVQFIIPSLEDE